MQTATTREMGQQLLRAATKGQAPLTASTRPAEFLVGQAKVTIAAGTIPIAPPAGPSSPAGALAGVFAQDPPRSPMVPIEDQAQRRSHPHRTTRSIEDGPEALALAVDQARRGRPV